ncbi:MAG: hypothetical protein L6Q98_14350 [Anaerolineae bacterium]|nr:hypothetical protein [Anaerolineae bacterium]NUQ04805.1 hypothetical protein [Anaerolineae bacterium]
MHDNKLIHPGLQFEVDNAPFFEIEDDELEQRMRHAVAVFSRTRFPELRQLSQGINTHHHLRHKPLSLCTEGLPVGDFALVLVFPLQVLVASDLAVFVEVSGSINPTLCPGNGGAPLGLDRFLIAN